MPEFPRSDRHARRAAPGVGSLGAPHRAVRRPSRSGPATGSSCRRCSRTSACSNASVSATDVVRKEMYDFDDKGGRPPRAAAGGHRLGGPGLRRAPPATPWKVWYVGPNFRYERPQTGRYRQHHQVGVEVLGIDDPDVDVEVIALLDGVYRGSRASPVHAPAQLARRRRPPAGYIERAATLPRAHAATLSDERPPNAGQANPLRVLDSKRAEDADGDRDAPPHRRLPVPTMPRPISSGCRAGLRAARRAVRDRRPGWCAGLDYYRRTTFEFASRRAGRRRRTRSAAAVATTAWSRSWAGRRRRASASAPGIERDAAGLRRRGRVPRARVARVDVFVVDIGRRRRRRSRLAHELRARRAPRRPGVRRAVDEVADEGGRPLGRPLALIVGEQELADGTVTVRDLRDDRRQRGEPGQRRSRGKRSSTT